MNNKFLKLLCCVLTLALMIPSFAMLPVLASENTATYEVSAANEGAAAKTTAAVAKVGNTEYATID